MDRGRVGYDLVGNRSIREKAINVKKKCHKERLKKIIHRAPGSSPTLDNTVPISLSNQMIANDPRKKSIKIDKALKIERENRTLLQRISMVLTAPPKVSDDDYQRMKKLVTRTKVGENFERELLKKRQEEIERRIKSTGAYYKVKHWEEDYQKQLAGQKFMRQVRYKRPPGFVDPFAPPKTDEESYDETNEHVNIEELLQDIDDKPVLAKTSPSRPVSSPKKGSNHINSLRTLKKKTALSSSQPSLHADSGLSRSTNASRRNSHSSSVESNKNAHGKLEDSLLAEHEEVNAINKGAPKLLAHMHRHAPLHDGRGQSETLLHHDAKKNSLESDTLTDIQCWRKEIMSDQLQLKGIITKLDHRHRAVSMGNEDDDLGDDASIHSAKETAGEKIPPYPVPVLLVTAELLEGTQREATIILVIDKLSENWRAHNEGRAAGTESVSVSAAKTFNIFGDEAVQNEYDDDYYKSLAREVAQVLTLKVEDDPKGHAGNGNKLCIELPDYFAVAKVKQKTHKQDAKRAENHKDPFLAASSYAMHTVSSIGSGDLDEKNACPGQSFDQNIHFERVCYLLCN